MACEPGQVIVCSGFRDTGRGDNDAVLQRIRDCVERIRQDTTDLGAVRDQYIIQLRQCQEDHGVLRRIYYSLRQHVDRMLYAGSATTLGGQADARSSEVSTRSSQFLEGVKLSTAVTSHGSATEASVRLRYAVRGTTAIARVRYSRDSSMIAFADDHRVFVIRAADGEVIRMMECEIASQRRALEFSPNNEFIAVGGSNNSVLLYSIGTGELVGTYVGHTGEVTSIVFNADGSWIVSGGCDGIVVVWNTSTREQVKRLVHDGRDESTIVDIATTTDVPFYAIGFMSGLLGIYDENFDQPMMAFAAHKAGVLGSAVSASDATIATVSDDHAVKVWSVRGVASCKYILEGHTDSVRAVTFAPREPIMITGSDDASVRLWQYKTGKPLLTVTPGDGAMIGVDHHKSDRSFVSCGGNGLVCVWDYDELA